MDAAFAALLDLGEALLAAGAEPYRIEEALERAGAGFGLAEVQAFATPPGLFMSAAAPGGDVSGLRRVRRRSLDLARLVALSDLARRAEDGALTAADCRRAVAAQRRRPADYPAWLGLLAGAGAAGAFALLLGGRATEIGMAALGGLGTVWLRDLSRGRYAEQFFLTSLGALLVGLLSVVGAHLFGMRAGIVVSGGLIVLVPGLAVFGALRDLLAGDLLSCVATGLEAGAVALALAAGVAVAVAVGLQIGWMA